MHTNIISFIFLLVFLNYVTSQGQLLVVDLVNGLDNDKLKNNETYKHIGNEQYPKLLQILLNNLAKYDPTDKGSFAIKDEFDYGEPEIDEQETFNVENCRSLRPEDIRACLIYKINKLKYQNHKTEVGRDQTEDIFDKFKTPDDCQALDAKVTKKLQCLPKFNNKQTENNDYQDYEIEDDNFANVPSQDTEDCWNLQNTPLSGKILCLENLYEKNGEVDYDNFNHLNDPNDCLLLEKTTIQRKLECLITLEKKNSQDLMIMKMKMKNDEFENIKEPNECLFIKSKTMESKLKCLEKFEKKESVAANDLYKEFENVKDPNDCLSLKDTITKKYKCLEKFGKGSDDDQVVVIDEYFDNLTDSLECLFLTTSLERKLQCLDHFHALEEKAKEKAKQINPTPTIDKKTLRIDEKEIKGPEECLFAFNSYGKKLNCLEQFEKRKEMIRSRGIEPNFHNAFMATRPKRKIYSLYNYYNAIVKPAGFKDLTRAEFSQDYLDISELSRSIPKCRTPECNVDVLKLSYKLKEKKPDLINNSRRIFDSVHTRYIQADSDNDSDEIENPKPPKKRAQKTKNGVPVRFTVVSKEKPADSESDEHKADANMKSFEDKQDSDEFSNEKHQNTKKKIQSPKKKHTVFSEGNAKESFLLLESEEDVNEGISSEESESQKKNIEKKKKKKPKKSRDDDYSIETERPSSYKYSYLQGNNVVDFFRRRLDHFLPKRSHWDEEDFKNLGYHWYDGPKGRWSK